MNNNEVILTLVKSLINQDESNKSSTGNQSFWQVGKQYFIRTVTMHVVGKLEQVDDKELLLSKASWIADSGRFNNFLKNGDADEIEPFVNDVLVGRGSIIDATIWDHKLPSEVK